MEKRNGKTVSIIVPVYNGERYLERCLESILCQTWKNMEVLLINDGSTDGSGRICDGFSEKDRRVRTIHTENKGVSSARNLGLDVCRGDYVAFVDADDCLAGDMVEHLADILEKTGCDVAGCGFWIFGEKKNEEKSGRNTAASGQTEVLTGAEFMEKGILQSDTRCWSKLYRREAIGGIRFQEGLTIGEDMLFLLDLASAGRTFGQSAYRGYGYFINDEGAMMHSFKDSYMDQITCWEKALPVLKAADSGLTDKAEAILLVSVMLTVGKMAALPGKIRKEKQAYAERCRFLVKEYGRHKGAFQELDRGYRIKVLMYRYMPGVYMWLYGRCKG